MVDVEKIKKGLDVCRLRSAGDCTYCPYFESTYCDTLLASDAAEYIASLEERLSIMQESMEALEKRCNALEALEQRCKALEKQNEPVKVRHLHNVKVTMHEGVTFTDECGNCGGYLMKSWKACPLCGLAVKWDE